MMLLLAIFALCWASIFPAVTGAAVGEVALKTRDGDADAVNAVAKALRAASLERRDHTYTTNQTSLAKSWAGATLFSISTRYTFSLFQFPPPSFKFVLIFYYSTSSNAGAHGTVNTDASISLICATCYINGSVRGSLTINDDFNLTQVIDGFKSELENTTKSALDTLENYAENLTETVIKDISNFEWSEIPALPTFQNVDFDIANLTSLPSVNGRFEFDDLELYLDLELKLAAGATYTLNLFTSETEAGFSVQDLEVGAVFSVSLILMSKAEIDISSGIHLKMDDGLALDLELFNNNTSGITL